MLLIQSAAMTRALRRFVDARGWVAAWTDVVERANWRSIVDVRKDYPSADGVQLRSSRVVTVFNVRGNQYRLLTFIDYDGAAVFGLDVLTHAEYNKDAWKRKY